MIKVEIPQDVTTYKEHLFFGLTTRQIASVVAMLALAIITFVLFNKVVNTTVLVYAIVLEVAPLAAFGFIDYNGMTAEKIAKVVITFYTTKQRRKMKYMSSEQELHETIRKIALQEAERERAAELKADKERLKKEKKSKLLKSKEKKGKNNAAAIN